MKNLIQAAVVTLFAASTAQAQQSVQWKVSDGGNGHWYQFSPVGSFGSWTEAQEAASDEGGHLATLASPGELGFVETLAQCVGCPGWGPSWAIGGFQNRAAPGYAEPAEGWQWVTGEPWSYSPWSPGEPNDSGGSEDFLYLHCNLHGINDGGDPTNGCIAAVFEWSADCNGDGIVDYGQCHDGTLPDYNGNNIPDCCERGEACEVGNYPVQWRSEDGGNGHWYRGERASSFVSWSQAKALAVASGGSLTSIGDASESQWVYAWIASKGWLWASNGPYAVGPWIGGRGGSGNWRWDDGTAWTYSAWYPGEGPPSPDPTEQFAHFFNGAGAVVPANRWGDYFDVLVTPSYIIEWSADCNGDGIVDYGQILQGQLADLNSNGIPDVCEQPTCVDADLFRDFNVNGADLGILLSQWGPNTELTVSDINEDGFVNGADLGILLSFWGACP